MTACLRWTQVNSVLNNIFYIIQEVLKIFQVIHALFLGRALRAREYSMPIRLPIVGVYVEQKVIPCPLALTHFFRFSSNYSLRVHPLSWPYLTCMRSARCQARADAMAAWTLARPLPLQRSRIVPSPLSITCPTLDPIMIIASPDPPNLLLAISSTINLNDIYMLPVLLWWDLQLDYSFAATAAINSSLTAASSSVSCKLLLLQICSVKQLLVVLVIHWEAFIILVISQKQPSDICKRISSLVGKDIELDAVGSQFESYFTAGQRRMCPCVMAWDAVPEQSCSLKLLRKPTFKSSWC